MKSGGAQRERNQRKIRLFPSHLDLNGLLGTASTTQPAPPHENGEHVDLPLLPVQRPPREQQPGLREQELVLAVHVGDETLRGLLVLQQVGQVRNQDFCNKIR